MFSIHGLTGQVFSGTLEEMIRVRALARARAARAIAEEGDESVVEPVARSRSRTREEAVRAYRAMLPPSCSNTGWTVFRSPAQGAVWSASSRAATSCARSSSIRR
jgi:hypothetical protein